MNGRQAALSNAQWVFDPPFKADPWYLMTRLPRPLNFVPTLPVVDRIWDTRKQPCLCQTALHHYSRFSTRCGSFNPVLCRSWIRHFDGHLSLAVNWSLSFSLRKGSCVRLVLMERAGPSFASTRLYLVRKPGRSIFRAACGHDWASLDFQA